MKQANYPSNRPDMALLSEFAPADAWQAALDVAAERCNSQRYRMGAALILPTGEVVTGWSHTGNDPLAYADHFPMASAHAERHALAEAAHLDLTGAICLVIGINRNGDGCPWSSCPCLACATALHNRGVTTVMYPQRTADRGWTVHHDSVTALLDRAPEKPNVAEGDTQFYARHTRLCR